MKTLLLLLPFILLYSCATMDSPSSTADYSFPSQILVSRAAPASIQFYEQAFSWDAVSLDKERMWLLQTAEGQAVGGVIQVPVSEEEEAAAVWLTTLVMPDLHAVLKKVKAEGGQVTHGPVTVKGGYETAIIEDPQGAMLQIREGDPAVDGFADFWVWRELVTGDVKKAAVWLEATLGVTTRPTETDGRMEILRAGQPIAGISENPLQEAPNQWIPVLAVQDLRAAIQQVTQAGGDVVVTSDTNTSVVLIADSLNAPLILQQVETSR